MTKIANYKHLTNYIYKKDKLNNRAILFVFLIFIKIHCTDIKIIAVINI